MQAFYVIKYSAKQRSKKKKETNIHKENVHVHMYCESKEENKSGYCPKRQRQEDAREPAAWPNQTCWT